MVTAPPDRRTLIVVFGAAVQPDGRASPTLARRVGYAAATAERLPDAQLFLSGGLGRYPPSEAAVMAALISGVVHSDRLTLDEHSCDTLQTVSAAAAYARAHDYSDIVTCTDGYHQPRVRMLFRLFRFSSRPVAMTPRGSRKLLWKMWLREGAAIPYDLIAGMVATGGDSRGQKGAGR